MPFGAFDPQTVKLFSSALQAAWHDLETDEPKNSAAKKAKLIRALTHNLLAAADAGERDPQKLKAWALNGAAQDR